MYICFYNDFHKLFFKACEKGDLKLVEMILKLPIPDTFKIINSEDKTGKTALYYGNHLILIFK